MTVRRRICRFDQVLSLASRASRTIGFTGPLTITQAEGDCGVVVLTFTVERSGGTVGAIDVLRLRSVVRRMARTLAAPSR